MSAVSYVTVLCLTPDTCTNCYVTTPSIAQRTNTVVTVTWDPAQQFSARYMELSYSVALYLICPGFDFRWDEVLHSSIYRERVCNKT
jgi:hypothetical protein